MELDRAISPDLCEPCGLPEVCASSGVIAALATLAFTIIPVSFFLLLTPAPCDTAFGGCGSISCVCGSYYIQGYVFMFATLLLLSTMLLRELGSLNPRTRGQRHCRAAMCAGSLAILLTGIYPEHLELDGDRNLDAAYSAAFALHALGLTAACTLTVAVPFGWMVVTRHQLGDRVASRRLLAVRASHVALAMAASVAFAAVRAHADVTDYCQPLGGSAAACAAWPAMPSPACATIQRPTRYRCGYVNNTLTADATRLLPAEYVAAHRAACRKDRCTLYVNARSIACEFASLFFICTCERFRFKILVSCFVFICTCDRFLPRFAFVFFISARAAIFHPIFFCFCWFHLHLRRPGLPP
jgi:hypothetical protein